MAINTNTWNKIRYTIYQPFYDMAGGVFAEYREQSIRGLALQPDEKVLIVGAGTGLDLEFLTDQKNITAIDITSSMVADLMQRAEELGVSVKAKVMDGQDLAFADRQFDVVILHLILAVIPDPEQCLREVRRVLKPKGRIAVMDKFVPPDGHVSWVRKMLNPVTNFFFSDITRHINALLEATGFDIHQDETFRMGFRVVHAGKKSGFRLKKQKEIRENPATPPSTSFASATDDQILAVDNPFYIGKKQAPVKQAVETEQPDRKDYDLKLEVFDKFPELTTKRLRLRQFTAADASMYYQLRSNETAMQYMDTARCTSPTKAMSQIKSMNLDFQKRKAIWWAISPRRDNEVFGYFGIYDIDTKNKSAEIAYLLHPDYWLNGIMTEAATVATRFAFDSLNCHRLSANTNPDNEASRALLEKLDFKKEAHFRQDYFFDGKFLDSVIYGKLKAKVS